MPAVTEQFVTEFVVEGLGAFKQAMRDADSAMSGLDARGRATGGGLGGFFDGVLGHMQTIGKATLAAAAAVETAVVTAGGAAVKLALDASKYDSIRDSFESMAQGMGVSAEELERRVGEASGGTIDRMTILQNTTQTLSLIGAGAFNDFGADFAKAAELVKKASRATGQDVNFLFDSFVMGIGRESPLILDNLGITLDMTQVKKDYAASIGKAADALTEEEAKAAVLQATMRALEQTYGNVAVSAGGLNGATQQLKTWFADLRLELGEAAVPAVNSLLRALMPLGEELGTRLVVALQQVATWLAPVVEAFVGFFGRLGEGVDPLTAFKVLLMDLLPPDLFFGILNVITGIEGFIAKAKEVLEPVAAWIGQNVELSDVFAALGATVATVIIPILASVISSVAPVIAVFAGVMAAVVLLREAWENNFLGIRDLVTSVFEFIKAVVQASLASIQQFWADHGAALTAVASAIWEGIKAIVETAITIVRGILDTVTKLIHGDWAGAWETIKSTAEEIWGTIKETISEQIELLRKGIAATMGDISLSWGEIWSNIKDKAGEIWDGIKDTISRALESIKSAFTNIDWGALGRSIIDGIKNGIENGIGAIADAARSAAQAALDAAKDFLGIHSPSQVMRVQVGRPAAAGMAEGIADMGPALQAQVRTAVSGMIAAPAVSHITNTSQVFNTYNLTTQSLVRDGGLRLEFEAMAASGRVGI